MGIIAGAGKLTAGSAQGFRKVAVGLYDFATDGGAVSTITLRGDSIPSGAVIVDALIKVNTMLTSGGSATVTIGTEGAADIQSSTAYNAAPFSSTGSKRTTFTATTAPVTTTASRSITITVGTAALTAGAFHVYVFYIEPSSQT